MCTEDLMEIDAEKYMYTLLTGQRSTSFEVKLQVHTVHLQTICAARHQAQGLSGLFRALSSCVVQYKPPKQVVPAGKSYIVFLQSFTEKRVPRVH